VSGGTWGGCVYDTEEILKVLEAGQRALGVGQSSRTAPDLQVRQT
jgi:hypothetical protein